MQESLPSFLVSADRSPDHQAFTLCSKMGRKKQGCRGPRWPLFRAHGKDESRPEGGACLSCFWACRSRCVHGCIWGALGSFRHPEISCQWQRSPGGPELTESLGIKDFHRKGKSWEDSSLQKRPGPGVGSEAAEGWAGRGTAAAIRGEWPTLPSRNAGPVVNS